MTEKEKHSLKTRLGKRFSYDKSRVMEIVKEEIDKTETTTDRLNGECRDKLKEVFREASEISGDLFHLSQIERIIDGEDWLSIDRPHGEWIWKKDETALRDYDLICSNCGDKIFTYENCDSIEQAKALVDSLVASEKTIPNFCKNCGSDNRKEGEEK